MKVQGQKGFTLIELIVVIVILGILAATAVPKLTGIDTNAKSAVLDGAAAAINSAASICYATNKKACKPGTLTGSTYLSISDSKVVVGATSCTVTLDYQTTAGTTDSGVAQKSVAIDSTFCDTSGV